MHVTRKRIWPARPRLRVETRMSFLHNANNRFKRHFLSEDKRASEVADKTYMSDRVRGVVRGVEPLSVNCGGGVVRSESWSRVD